MTDDAAAHALSRLCLLGGSGGMPAGRLLALAQLADVESLRRHGFPIIDHEFSVAGGAAVGRRASARVGAVTGDPHADLDLLSDADEAVLAATWERYGRAPDARVASALLPVGHLPEGADVPLEDVMLHAGVADPAAWADRVRACEAASAASAAFAEGGPRDPRCGVVRDSREGACAWGGAGAHESTRPTRTGPLENAMGILVLVLVAAAFVGGAALVVRGREEGLGIGLMAGSAVAAVLCCAGFWLTHVIVCIERGEWGFLVAGALFFPIAMVHGFGLWIGVF